METLHPLETKTSIMQLKYIVTLLSFQIVEEGKNKLRRYTTNQSTIFATGLEDLYHHWGARIQDFAKGVSIIWTWGPLGKYFLLRICHACLLVD